MTALHLAALGQRDDGTLAQLIRKASAAELNQANALGHTPMHYIFATRPWELALLAWKRGGGPGKKTLQQENAWDWRAMLRKGEDDSKLVQKLMELMASTQSSKSYPHSYVMRDLHWMALKGDNEIGLERAISGASAATLNQQNALGHTPMHYIFATQSWELALLAWERGGNPDLKTRNGEDSWDWRSELNDDEYLIPVQALLRGRHPPKLTGDEFRVQPTFANTEYSDELAALEMLARTARLVHGANPERLQVEQQWQGRLNAQRREQARQKAAFETLRAQIASVDVEAIAEPQLPPVQKYQKDVFETVAMFNERLAQARADRERQTSEIMAAYRARVEARNARVQQAQAAYAQLEKDIAAYNQQLATQQQGLQRERLAMEQKLADIEENERRLAVVRAYELVYGAPILKPLLVNGQAKYDAENATLHLLAEFPAVGRDQEITIKLPPGDEARTVFRALQSGQLQSSALFAFQDDGSVLLKSVNVNHQQSQYLASLQRTDDFQATEAVEVVLASKDSLPELQQEQLAEQQLVSVDSVNLSQIQLQNPVIKDTEFETYLRTEQQNFNDDVPQLLARAQPAAEDRSKWLFVIGIENYKTTDDILFSRRSADLFKQVAMKTLGIRERQAYVLLDDDATSASIQDKLRFMLRNVKAGDKIYFYYSGHGIPAPNKDNAAYILAADKSPDFVADNDFFAVDSIYKTLTDSPASQVIAFMDSCFTGQTDGKSVFGGTKAATALAPKRSQFDTSKMAIITAGTDRQFSNALQGRGHRLFSYYLMQSMLNGRSDIASLYKEVSLNVEDASRELGDINLQQPVLTGNADLAL